MNPQMKVYLSFLVIMITEGFVPPPLATETFVAIPPDGSPEDTHPGSPLFFDAVDNGHYVDHTGLIQEVIDKVTRMSPYLIAAPPRFGKTMNLDMIHNFFRIPFSTNGTILPAEKSAAYSRFVKNPLIITKSPCFRLFASRPVLYLDFKPFGDFKSLKELAIKFRQVFQEAVNLFPFIKTNPEYEDFRSKCFLSNATYDTISIDNNFNRVTKVYQNCIDDLLQLIRNHFGKQVLVLIDEATLIYQNLINNAHFLGGNVVEECIEFLGAILYNLVNDAANWKSFLTGVIRYSDCDWETGEDFDYIEYESILGSHNFLSFYGFSQQEVDSLYEKRKLKLSKETSMSWIKRNLKGYRGDKTPAGEAFYCPGDIDFLLYNQQQTGMPELIFYRNPSALQPFKNTIAPNILGVELFSLSERGISTPLTSLELWDIRTLLAAVETAKSPDEYMTEFHIYLLEHGFLTVVSKSDWKKIIAISNEVMRETLEDALMQVHYFKELYGISDRMIQAYQDSVINLDNTQESVEKLTKAVADLFWTHLDIGPDWKPAPAEVKFHASAYCFLRELKREFSMLRGELPYDTERVTGTAKSRIKEHGKKGPRLDIFAFRKNGRVAIIFEIKHDPHLKKGKSALGALEQIKEKNCVEILNLTEYRPVKKYILVGMHLGESKCECSVVYNTEDLDKRKTAKVDRLSQVAHH